VRGVHKEDLALALGGLRETRGELLLKEVELELAVHLAGQRRVFFQTHAHLLHRAAALALAQTQAGERFDACDGGFGVGHWRGGKRAAQAVPERCQTAERTIGAIFQNGRQPALLILGEIGAQSGLGDVENASDESVCSTFVMHAQSQQFVALLSLQT